MTAETNFRHGGFKMFSIILTLFFYIAVLVFNYLTMQNFGTDIGIFTNNTGDVSRYFQIEITPANWTFAIWGFIYAWQLLFIVYAMTTLCRKTESGYLYMHSSQMPTGIYWIYIFNNLLNVAWLILWDRFMVEWSLLVIVFIPITLYIMILLTVRALNAGQASLANEGMGREIWFNRFFVQNAFGIYAAWTTIASLINFAVVMAYKVGLDQAFASTVSLGVLAFLLVVWIIMDLIVCDKYTRFLFTPYIVVAVALAGSMHLNWVPTKRNSIFTAVLEGVDGAALIIKFISMIYRQCTSPIPATGKEKRAAYQADAEAQSEPEKLQIVEPYTGNL
ncbi:uncharacterized protein LOC135497649 [Lineus longissimus]|uniref:uncharacterized protein LOC135497649 n=1 Tax=Lineus longissimus TaxID=88925 RepID=UPI002B4CF17D